MNGPRATSAEEAAAGTPARVARPVVDLLRAPDGPRDRQLLWGETVTVLGTRAGWSHVQAARDGYTGYVPETALGPAHSATHRVSAAGTHVYAAPDIKSPDRVALSFGSRLCARDETDEFVETADGFVPAVHLAPAASLERDPVAVAGLFLGTPYLWGGNSRFGIDCSGLVQAAMLACGTACPGDSGQQEAALGTMLPPASRPLRGDLLFWAGHVAMVSDPDTLIHANAHHMAVCHEPLRQTIQRIAQQGGGPVTSHRRPDTPAGSP